MIALAELHACLDRLEEQEALLLSWGDSGGFFSRSEVITLLEKAVPHHDPEELLAEMLQCAMVIEAPHPEGLRVYRTRMGEAVNLYRNLRQWFHGKRLDEARTLVSDFRFVRRPRSYPKRELISLDLLSKWQQDLGLEKLEDQAIRALLEPLEEFRLAGFQARATERILRAWRHHSKSSSQASGTIVCAGTGSGKTLAFYLPAIAALGADIRASPSQRVRILAIYPRKELLKDQFMETWGQSRKLDNLLTQTVGRKIRIGAFFGDTPMSVQDALNDVRKNKGSTGLKFDLLRCPNDNCQGYMLWTRQSLEAKREELSCSACGHIVGGDEVGLTRKSLSQSPPDILFTTTEMLNQHLGNHYHNGLFGVGSQKGPTLVLLDEVHTYGGNTGAQTAYLLRRWMQRAACRPHFVGLSATLADAENMFAELVGAKQQHVELVEPKAEEMIDEGAEYLLALRGDPVSQTALLSTTIQASMLTRRILDNRNLISKGTWGSKTFVFTDDLDVTNRLYHQLADAEGWKTTFRGLSADGEPLASLRRSGVGNISSRQQILLGQDWRVATDIGHSLTKDDRAKIARTSSQDTGVDPQAEVVVATATLEVGFNDPQVGAVIQHKAPRDVASYLQRKGRAGRPKIMRPWMLIVLSEFGRDRVAFQRYEELVSPEIKRQGLPLHNGHIQKMQAAMATLDWLSMKLGHGSIWTILNKPQNKANECGVLLGLVEALLVPGGQQDAFFQYLKYALRVDEDELERVLWAPPRSLMMEFLPTLRRLLSTDWREDGEPWRALRPKRSPMPQFIPEALFSDLNLPSLSIALQRGRENRTVWEDLSFYQALREFAPGRISKRYAINSDFDADWLAPSEFKPTTGDRQYVAFDVSEAFGNALLEEGEASDLDGHVITVYRPQEIYTRGLGFQLGLTERSNARLSWRVNFRVSDQTPLYAPPEGDWRNYLADLTFCTHQHLTPLEIIRYNTGSQASLRFKRGERAEVEFNWQRHGKTVGIGTRQWVDGMRLRFRVGAEDIRSMLADRVILRSLRPLFFRSLVEQLKSFDADMFRANWVTECYLAALARELQNFGREQEHAVREALEVLASKEGLIRLRAIPNSLFQPDDQLIAGKEQELQSDLKQLLSDPSLLSELANCAQVLWREPSELVGFENWVRILLGNTLGAATQQTICILFPDVDERAVTADAVWEGDELTVWLSEVEAGGSGVISRLSRAYFEDPVRVLNVFARSLQPGDYEQIDFDLYSVLQSAKPGTVLANALSGVRGSMDHQQRRVAIGHLHKALQEAGFSLTHSFLTVLHSRLLRPGSSVETDDELLDLLSQWRDLEQTSGLEWALNIAAHALSSRKLGADIDDAALFGLFCRTQGLLWPRGHTIRQSELNYYSPFQNGPALTERLLGASLFTDLAPQVDYADEKWLPKIHDALRTAGRVDLSIARGQIEDVSVAITRLHLEPVDHLGLFLYPRIGSVRREEGNVVLRVELAEALQ